MESASLRTLNILKFQQYWGAYSGLLKLQKSLHRLIRIYWVNRSETYLLRGSGMISQWPSTFYPDFVRTLRRTTIFPTRLQYTT